MNRRAGVEALRSVVLNIHEAAYSQKDKLVVAGIGQVVVHKGHQAAAPAFTDADVSRLVTVPSQQPVLTGVEALERSVNSAFTVKQSMQW